MESKGFMSMQSLWGSLSDFTRDVLFKDVPRIIIALIILWIGLKLIKLVVKAMRKMLERRNVDVSLQSFLISMTDIALKAMVVIAVMGMVGIQTTSFIAVLGAAGLAVGMALQGTLQNFAGGVIILLLKPFKVGDYIDSAGVQGTVKHIQIFNTIVETPDKKMVIAPNTDLATKTLVNYSRSENRRVDIKVGIAYGESVDSARAALMELAKSYSKVIEEPAPMVVVTALADSAVSLELRVWVKNADYWDTFFYLNQAVYDKLNAVGISIPFNQMDVHIINK
ncbi:MAG: mechanosensitive ion channel family protein [Bacteroidales bacterium]|nr:mechanosensitive ion channel family protein [Bacteroidales bacterium]